MHQAVRIKGRIILKLITLSVSFFFSPLLAFSNPEGIQVYKRDLHTSPTHMKKLAADIMRYRKADNIWDVLREEFTLPHYENHPLVREKIIWFMYNQDYVLRSAYRASPYLYYILQQVKKRHLPAELVLLPIIESGYNPFSLSNMGAAGIWQLMPGTATGLGIRQDKVFDGRRDIVASTKGALNYLAYLQSFFEGNWLLAIAAYNTGEGNVVSAIRRNIREGRDTNFWRLPLAQQTRDYVPSLLALATIISHPERYPLYFPKVRNAPYLAQVELGKQVNLQHAANLAGLSYRKLLQLNPGFNRPNTSKRWSYKLILPIENVQQFSENFARSPLNKRLTVVHHKIKANSKKAIVQAKKDQGFLAYEGNPRPAYRLEPGDTIYMVRPKDKLERIAKRFHSTLQTLLVANGLTNRQLKTGQQLLIPKAPIKTAKPSLLPGDTIYVVKRGDTIEKLATKFQITPSAIRLTNGDKLHEGEKIVVPTHLRG